MGKTEILTQEQWAELVKRAIESKCACDTCQYVRQLYYQMTEKKPTPKIH